ncbi:hypothetical protein [Amycolatopsis sp. NPDC004169]|uniref:hypothetical protein n=1 Tax=Amycolatopsis sp. NPDC004169 TaxID=3154453 RepID=UPI0033B0ECD3
MAAGDRPHPRPWCRLIGQIERNFKNEPIKPYVALLHGGQSRHHLGQEIMPTPLWLF